MVVEGERPTGTVIWGHVPQTVVSSGMLGVASLVVAASWANRRTPSPFDALRPGGILLIVCLVAAVALAHRFPVHIRPKTKIFVATIPLYLTAVLLPVPLAALAGGLGVLSGELSARRKRGNTATDMLTHTARWSLLVAFGSIAGHLTFGSSGLLGHVIPLGIAAIVLWLGDILSLPLVLTYVTGERPGRIIVECAKESWKAEGTQYLLAVLGALVVPPYPGTLLLLVIPAVLVYRVAQLESLEVALRASEERYRALFENARDLVYIHDLEGNFLSMNWAMRNALGYAPEQEIQGLQLADVVAVKERNRIQQLLFDLKTKGAIPSSYELDISSEQGRSTALEVSSQTISRDGKPVAVQCIGRDVSERKLLEEQLRHQALHDDLTGLPNRSLLQDRLEQSMRSSERGGQQVVLLLMDLDRFKDINDTFGHLQGDRLLKEVAARLRGVVRGHDTVARLGGDEFAVLLTRTDERTTASISKRLLQSLLQPFEIEGLVLMVEASLGIALSPDHGRDPTVLLQRADVAMYVAKRRKSGYEVYSTAEDESDSGTLLLMAELRRASDEDQLVLHYQAQFNLQTRKVEGAEALIRWSHPRQGLLPPSNFLPFVEETGLVQPLTNWVLRTAVQEIARWQDAGQQVRVAVNLSARNVQDLSLVGTVRGLLTAYSVNPGCLRMEITENALMADPSLVIRALSNLHDLGVGLAIDDFGTGHSSLARLKQLPVDQIKIDHSFVKEMVNSTHDSSIVRNAISLSHDLNLVVVAEGVEDEASCTALASMGCDIGQGYYLSPPLPASDLLATMSGSKQSSPTP